MGEHDSILVRGLENQLAFLNEKNRDLEDNIKKILTITLTITSFAFIIAALIFNNIDSKQLPEGSLQIFLYFTFVSFSNLILFSFAWYLINAFQFLRSQSIGYRFFKNKDGVESLRIPLSFESELAKDSIRDIEKIYSNTLIKEITFMVFAYGDTGAKYKRFNKISMFFIFLVCLFLVFCTFLFLFI
ncbi:MAG: hypothetical protein ACTSP3_12715 [Candidatus Heimdallarchaeaceae archaeon]